MAVRFRDRSDAGRQLAAKLMKYAHRSDVLILALPRGGVPVAFEVAQAINAPLDVLIVRKLGMPGLGELAVGAIVSRGVVMPNPALPNPRGTAPGTFSSSMMRARRRRPRVRRQIVLHWTNFWLRLVTYDCCKLVSRGSCRKCWIKPPSGLCSPLLSIEDHQLHQTPPASPRAPERRAVCKNVARSRY